VLLFWQHLLSVGFHFCLVEISYFKLYIECFHLHVGCLRYVSLAVGQNDTKCVLGCYGLFAFRSFCSVVPKLMFKHLDCNWVLIVAF